MVVFILPSCANDKDPVLEIGLVMSVWKGIKDPKVVATDCHVNSCMAFRAISLQMEDEDRMSVSILEKDGKGIEKPSNNTKLLLNF